MTQPTHKGTRARLVGSQRNISRGTVDNDDFKAPAAAVRTLSLDLYSLCADVPTAGQFVCAHVLGQVACQSLSLKLLEAEKRETQLQTVLQKERNARHELMQRLQQRDREVCECVSESSAMWWCV